MDVLYFISLCLAVPFAIVSGICLAVMLTFWLGKKLGLE